jgi:spermidine synthase
MVHFLKRYDPAVRVDVVEIDPVVVDIADKYFGVRSEGNVNIITVDALEYLADAKTQYDVIYMDAFLKPSGDTDANGVPLRLKASTFYQHIQKSLLPEGLVVFNLNPHAGTRDDILAISRDFPQVYVYRLTDSAGLVAVASQSAKRESPSALARKAKELDRRFRATFSFARMAGRLVP